MATDDDLLGIGLALAMVAGVMLFAMSGSVYVGVAKVDVQRVAAMVGDWLCWILGITGL